MALLLFFWLASLAFAAPVSSDFKCEPLILHGFGGKHTAYLNINVYYFNEGTIPTLPANIQAHYPVNLAIGKNQTGTALSLESCTSASLDIGYSKDPDDPTYQTWTGLRLRNPATGHCLTVRNPNTPMRSDFEFRVCDPNPGKDTATQLMRLDQHLTLDAHGKAQGSQFANVTPQKPPFPGMYDDGCWSIGKDGITVQVDYAFNCNGMWLYASLIPTA